MRALQIKIEKSHIPESKFLIIHIKQNIKSKKSDTFVFENNQTTRSIQNQHGYAQKLLHYSH